MSRGNRYRQVGIDRPIRLDWLEKTARLLLIENSDDNVAAGMTKLLAQEFPGADPTIRGSLSKTLTILMKTWVKVPKDLRSFRDRGLELLVSNGQEIKIPIHWGMLMSAYPFWGVVAQQSGRLLQLQGSVMAAQLQRRLKEQYGERETVSRRARYVMRSFIDWGVLQETGTKGAYQKGGTIQITNTKLSCWLLESCLNMREEKAADIRELREHHSLFPFSVSDLTDRDLIKNIPSVNIDRHSLSEIVIRIVGYEGS